MQVMRIGTKLFDVEIVNVPDDNILHGLQALVDGYIEICTPYVLKCLHIEILCNEEGLLKNLEPNINVCPYFLAGPLVAVGCDGEEFVSLNEDQIEARTFWLAELAG